MTVESRMIPGPLSLNVGDVFSFAKGSTGLPDKLAGKFFRVEAEEGAPGQVMCWKLSMPYEDAACTVPCKTEGADDATKL